MMWAGHDVFPDRESPVLPEGRNAATLITDSMVDQGKCIAQSPARHFARKELHPGV
jgi:hypothetical protein